MRQIAGRWCCARRPTQFASSFMAYFHYFKNHFFLLGPTITFSKYSILIMPLKPQATILIAAKRRPIEPLIDAHE